MRDTSIDSTRPIDTAEPPMRYVRLVPITRRPTALPASLALVVSALLAGCAAPDPSRAAAGASDRAAADSAFADSVLRAAEDLEAVIVERPSTNPAPVRDPEAARLALATHGSGTYIDELFAARDSVNYRWPDRARDPLRVWIQSAPLEADERAFPRAVQEAFDPWTETGIPVGFEFVDDSARAEVHVTWVARYESRTTGRTRWVHDQHGWITAASIELARAQPDGTPLDLASVRAIARHEVGHLLGLDHTADPRHVMAETVRVTELSEADRATVRLVYLLPPGRVRLP